MMKSKMDKEKLRDEGIKYLIESKFVDSYVRKLMFNSDIDNYYDDYRQEVYMVICELNPDIWEKLYQSALEKGKPYDYELRNYFSVVIRNIVKSDSSNTYRRLKGCKRNQQDKDESDWRIMAYNIPDENGIDEEIYNMHNRD